MISYAFASATSASGNPMDRALFLIDGFDVLIIQTHNNEGQKWDEKYIKELNLDVVPVEVNEIYTSGITVKMNSRLLYFDQQPIMEKDRVLVPFRKIFVSFGAEVNWDGENQIVTATKGEKSIVLQIDNPQIIVDGKTVLLDVPPRLVGQRTLVPVRAVSEGMGAKVSWHDERREVTISYLEVIQ